jgi:photosystem II stability/assembly factor-like uncharacterized protein
MSTDIGRWGWSADANPVQKTIHLPRDLSLKSGHREPSRLHGLRGAWAVGALVLVLGLFPWGRAVAQAPGAAEGMTHDQSLTDAAPSAPEGARKAIGWAVGMSSSEFGTILHTTDGGQTWERQGTPEELGDSNLSGAAAVSAQEAWAAGNLGENGLLLHTTDGGQHWDAEGDPVDLSGNGLVSVSAVDAHTAWAVGANGLILHTTDGGQHWMRQGAGLVPTVGLQGVYAADASHAWVVGPAEGSNRYGTILYTADGGGTWTKVPYAITHTPPPVGYYLITVHGVGANEVWAVGRDQIIHVSVTSTGVRTSDQTPSFGGGYDINGVFAVNKKTVWAVADNSVIWRSVNGGKKWHERSPQGAGYVFRVSALDKMHAWVTTGSYSGQGQILYTADGGKSWTPQPIPVNPQMWGISFVK